MQIQALKKIYTKWSFTAFIKWTHVYVTEVV